MATKCVIEGRRLCFRPLDKRYIDHYMSWLNDPNTNRHLGPIIGALFTREKVEEWYEVMKDQNDRRVFNLHTKGEENEPIGYCGLYRIDHRNDRATIQVIIGEDDCRGRRIRNRGNQAPSGLWLLRSRPQHDKPFLYGDK